MIKKDMDRCKIVLLRRTCEILTRLPREHYNLQKPTYANRRILMCLKCYMTERYLLESERMFCHCDKQTFIKTFY